MSPFAERPWRAVHTLHISGPFGLSTSALGVTVVVPEIRAVRAVLMSVEGVVMFDATSVGDKITVHRSIPALQRQGFAEGLLSDVGLTFLAPLGTLSTIGRNKAGRQVCRWRLDTGGTTDVTILGNGILRVDCYDDHGSLQREIEMTLREGGPMAERIVLTAHGIAGYKLDMELIEEEPVADTEDLLRP